MDFLLASASDVLRFETVLLIIVVIAVGMLAKGVIDLKAEVKSLRRGDSPAPSLPASPPVTAAASVPVPPDDGVTPEIFAVIVAALHASLGDHHRVVSVTSAETLWSREGRRGIFDSHSIR